MRVGVFSWLQTGPLIMTSPHLQVGSADGGSRKVFVIDEIGKMELFSQSFIRAVRQTLDSPSCTVLGTIPIPKGKPLGLVEEVRSRRDVKVFTVSTSTNTLAGKK